MKTILTTATTFMMLTATAWADGGRVLCEAERSVRHENDPR